MAQYWEDWSGSTIGQEPTGWTKRFVTSDVSYTVREDAAGPAGRRLRVSRSSNGRSGISMNALDADGLRARLEMRALVRLSGTKTGYSTAFNGCFGRGAGGASSESLVVSWVGKSSAGNRGLRNSQYIGGTLTTLDAPDADHWDIDTLYWIGMSADGDSLTCTLALESDPDNPIATLSSTTTRTDPGFAGYFIFSHAINADVLAIGIGTGGDAAPLSEPSGSTHELAGAATASISASGDLTTQPADAVKGVREQLGNGTTPDADLTGLSVRWWDNETATGAPDYAADDETTDASGWLEVNLDAVTALDVDDYGYLLVLKHGATTADDIIAGGRTKIRDLAS